MAKGCVLLKTFGVRACGVLAVVACVLAACQSPEEIQREQDEADDARCARMGVATVPGDPAYVQCRMWAAQMREQEEQDRRQAWLLALETMSALHQQRRAPATQMPAYGYAGGGYAGGLYDDVGTDDGPALSSWIVPPPPPPITWCRPVGRWMSCTGQ